MSIQLHSLSFECEMNEKTTLDKVHLVAREKPFISSSLVSKIKTM